jgi:hypothetical protein
MKSAEFVRENVRRCAPGGLQIDHQIELGGALNVIE